MSYGKKHLKRYVIKNGIEHTAWMANEDIDDVAKDWLDIENTNPVDENEYMKNYNSKRHITPQSRKLMPPMQRDVSTWSKADLDAVMKSRNYQYDDYTQKKVVQYLCDRFFFTIED